VLTIGWNADSRILDLETQNLFVLDGFSGTPDSGSPYEHKVVRIIVDIIITKKTGGNNEWAVFILYNSDFILLPITL
jgi:hypothetical protein